MTGGYTMVNCTGLNLLDEEEQTIPGIHEGLKTAIESGKPVFVYGAEWGTGNAITAIPVMVSYNSVGGSVILCTAGLKQLYITKYDVVTIG